MTQRNIRKVATAAALTMALAVTAPAQAATGHAAKAGPSWLQAAVHWVANLLPANWGTKLKQGIDPDGLTSVTPPPTDPDRGHGIDPDG
ncbi:MAG TPA: hypothetical protein VGS07_13070 [Thermoanaerobaculia bacterium]|jgi:hypothetical protein|nr:hypothetical protein [Thermoanaerobaculia bacterium]